MIYGCDLSSYTVIAALLQFGLEPSKLILVQPCAGEHFNNPTLEERVQGILQEMGVVVYTGYSLDGWAAGDWLKLQLQGTTEPLTVECKVGEVREGDREAVDCGLSYIGSGVLGWEACGHGRLQRYCPLHISASDYLSFSHTAMNDAYLSLSVTAMNDAYLSLSLSQP